MARKTHRTPYYRGAPTPLRQRWQQEAPEAWALFLTLVTLALLWCIAKDYHWIP